jgi:hypothetical protein
MLPRSLDVVALLLLNKLRVKFHQALGLKVPPELLARANNVIE